MRLAAATMLTTLPAALEALESALSEGGDPSERAALEPALAWADIGRERFDAAISTAERLAREHPRSQAAFGLGFVARLRAQRFEEAQRWAEQRLAASADDPQALAALGDAASHRGDTAAAERAYRRLVDTGKAEAGAFNQLAWMALVHDVVDDEAVALARQAVAHSRGKARGVLHTLAALYAAAGRVTEARETLLKSIDAGAIRQPQPADWYVVGRLAEAYGVPEAAREAYERLTAPGPREPVALSCYALAQRRLARLDEAPAR